MNKETEKEIRRLWEHGMSIERLSRTYNLSEDEIVELGVKKPKVKTPLMKAADAVEKYLSEVKSPSTLSEILNGITDKGWWFSKAGNPLGSIWGTVKADNRFVFDEKNKLWSLARDMAGIPRNAAAAAKPGLPRRLNTMREEIISRFNEVKTAPVIVVENNTIRVKGLIGIDEIPLTDPIWGDKQQDAVAGAIASCNKEIARKFEETGKNSILDKLKKKPDNKIEVHETAKKSALGELNKITEPDNSFLEKLNELMRIADEFNIDHGKVTRLRVAGFAPEQIRVILSIMAD